jgi:hypothetical protein
MMLIPRKESWRNGILSLLCLSSVVTYARDVGSEGLSAYASLGTAVAISAENKFPLLICIFSEIVI